MTSKSRFRHLLELAGDPCPEKRTELAQEIRAVLAEWPQEYGDAARAPFEALLDKITHERESDGTEEAHVIAALRSATRESFIATFARLASANVSTVVAALADQTGVALARLCRDAGLSRSSYSAIAILAGPGRARPLADMHSVLEVYAANEAPQRDSVPEPIAAE